MEKYKRYFGIVLFIGGVMALIFLLITIVSPRFQHWSDLRSESDKVSQTLETKRTAKINIQKKLQKLKESVITSQKKIYSPIEDRLGNDTLFFTLYSDVIEMVHNNTVKIKSIDYQYNPNGDLFVDQGSQYFVCDVNMEVVSNYTNLGKLIQDIYQYPYYIRINNIEVYPYPKDKKILLSKISLRLYAHTSPEEITTTPTAIEETKTIEGAVVPLPQ